MSKRDQEKEELYVFEQFTRVCPYNLDFSSAIKLDPPEPDIMCKSYNNKTYYFELMQLIDENLSKIFNNALRLQEDLSESLKSLEKERATKIDQKYNTVSYINTSENCETSYVVRTFFNIKTIH